MKNKKTYSLKVVRTNNIIESYIKNTVAHMKLALVTYYPSMQMTHTDWAELLGINVEKIKDDNDILILDLTLENSEKVKQLFNSIKAKNLLEHVILYSKGKPKDISKYLD